MKNLIQVLKNSFKKQKVLEKLIIDKENKTYEIRAYKFSVDVLDENPNNQFEGWPIIIHQEENKGHNKLT